MMKLYIDATGKYVAKQDEAKRAGKGWHQVEVPTTDGRQALADYLNALRWSEQKIVEQDFQTVGTVTGDPHSEDDHKPAFTQEQVDEMFTPSTKVIDLPRDKVCELISTYEGTDLGYVALEVAARFEALAKGARA
jgi:hypothetical protein